MCIWYTMKCTFLPLCFGTAYIMKRTFQTPVWKVNCIRISCVSLQCAQFELTDLMLNSLLLIGAYSALSYCLFGVANPSMLACKSVMR